MADNLEGAQEGIGNLKDQIEREIRIYQTGTVALSEDNDYSQARLVRRIAMFEDKIYPTGKFDTAGNYKYWFDISSPRINSEVKNIDWDTKDVKAYSERKIDFLPCLIVNLKLEEYMRQNGIAEDINDAIEQGSGWGNILWKKVKGGFVRLDLKNTYVINQTAKDVDGTPIIERHQLSQSELRAKKGVWDTEAVQRALDNYSEESYKSNIETQPQEKTVPYYDIYERNGEVCLDDLNDYMGVTSKEGDEDTYVMAKVIVCASKSQSSGVKVEDILFAQPLGKKKMSDIYKEFHRGSYKGRWFREGLYELFFDIQVRANQVGNQIALGLEWASKTFFRSTDRLIVQNILSDLNNGDLIVAKDMEQVPVQMQGMQQLIEEWNRIIQMANELANVNPFTLGSQTPNITAFRAIALFEQNAEKWFIFVKQKLSLPFGELFEQWIIPDLISELTVQDVISLTGDSEMMDRVYQLIVDDWYLRNLVLLPPHTNDMGDMLKTFKLDELKRTPQLLMTEFKAMFKDFEPYAIIDVSGERLTVNGDVQDLMQLAGMEADPVRRQAIIELIAKKKGIDLGALPKQDPQMMQGLAGMTGQPQQGMPAAPAAAQQVKQPVAAQR